MKLFKTFTFNLIIQSVINSESKKQTFYLPHKCNLILSLLSLTFVFQSHSHLCQINSYIRQLSQGNSQCVIGWELVWLVGLRLVFKLPRLLLLIACVACLNWKPNRKPYDCSTKKGRHCCYCYPVILQHDWRNNMEASE